MQQPISFYVYLFVIILAIISGCINYKKTDKCGKLILLLLIITLISESIGLILILLKKSKFPLYHFFVPVEILLYTIYFILLIKPYNNLRYILASSIFWPLAGMLNMIFLQPMHKLNSNMLIIENVVVVAMALYALYKILLNDKIVNVLNYPHFWVWTFSLIYECYAFFFWALFESLIRRSPYRMVIIDSQDIINIALYVAICFSFFLYPKKNTV